MTNNLGPKLLAIIISIVVWFIVVWLVDPDVTTSIKNVPIELGNSESSAIKKMGLDVIDGNNLFATVYMRGNRNIIGLIGADDILVLAQASNITEAGTYELEVSAGVKNQMYKDIKFSAISPSVIKVKIDKLITKTVPVEVICNGVTVPDGYLLEETVSSVDVVNITGPEKDIEKVDKAIVICDIDKKISETLKLTEEIRLRSNTDIDVDTKYINIDNEVVNITLPVLKKKILPVTVDFINQPKGFPTEEFEYFVEPSTITVAGLPEEVDKKESVNIAYIDMKNLSLEGEEEYKIEIPSNFVNVENVDKVKIKFDMTKMASKTFSDVRVKVPYVLADYDININ
ncbi:MAG: hypothetical protein J6C55_02645, partial [Oscillospiraceae bacterium]|nr:hypothetical protein [Oscillospiraceae bacterium]